MLEKETLHFTHFTFTIRNPGKNDQKLATKFGLSRKAIKVGRQTAENNKKIFEIY